MLHLHKPTREELRFRQELLSDPSTMSYNHAYGGTIVFPPARWEGWAARWLDAADGARFYRYLAREDGIFVGETAYHYDEAQRIYICALSPSGLWPRGLAAFVRRGARAGRDDALRRHRGG